jgi:hypothetical protein
MNHFISHKNTVGVRLKMADVINRQNFAVNLYISEASISRKVPLMSFYRLPRSGVSKNDRFQMGWS